MVFIQVQQSKFIEMRNLVEVNSIIDYDEDQFLNRQGSLVIMALKNKKAERTLVDTSGKIRLNDHLKNYSASYLIMLALFVTILVVVHIEREYQSGLSKVLAQSNQQKTVLKEENSRNKVQDIRNGQLFLEKNKDQEQQSLMKQSPKAKKPENSSGQINKVNKRQSPNVVLQDFHLDSLKKQIIQKAQNGQKNTLFPKIFTRQQNTGTSVSQKQVTKSVSTTKSSLLSRLIAGVSQEQRQQAKKWLKLKDQNIYQTSSLADEERIYYQEKYNISSYDELPICIVIPSYNNVRDNRHLKNIKSVVMQEYTNYHIVFIDDASNDGTGDQIQGFLVGQNKVPKEKYIVIKNKQQKRAMPNLRMAAKQYCQPQDIFIIVDGDDQLLGRQVLKLFNAIFQQKKAWFVYSNFLSIRGAVGYSRAFPQSTITGNKYRTHPFVTSHLRAFYTQLFVNINQTDLQDESGNYLKAANDVAICIPILQMSHQRVFYLPEITYYYNSNTGQNNHQLRLKQQKANDRMLRKRKSYARLNLLEFSPSLSILIKSQSSQNQSLKNLHLFKNATQQSNKNNQ